MSAIRGMFSGIEDAAAQGDRPPLLTEGEYPCLEIQELRAFKSKKPPFAPFFVADLLVHDSEGETAIKPGRTGTFLVNMTHPPALGNVKSFAIAAVPGLTEDEVTEEAMEAMLGDDQPLAGMKVAARAEVVTTKAGHPFTRVSFRPVAE